MASRSEKIKIDDSNTNDSDASLFEECDLAGNICSSSDTEENVDSNTVAATITENKPKEVQKCQNLSSSLQKIESLLDPLGNQMHSEVIQLTIKLRRATEKPINVDIVEHSDDAIYLKIHSEDVPVKKEIEDTNGNSSNLNAVTNIFNGIISRPPILANGYASDVNNRSLQTLDTSHQSHQSSIEVSNITLKSESIVKTEQSHIDKPYHCPSCDISFHLRTSLARHMRRHNHGKS